GVLDAPARPEHAPEARFLGGLDGFEPDPGLELERDAAEVPLDILCGINPDTETGVKDVEGPADDLFQHDEMIGVPVQQRRTFQVGKFCDVGYREPLRVEIELPGEFDD